MIWRIWFSGDVGFSDLVSAISLLKLCGCPVVSGFPPTFYESTCLDGGICPFLARVFFHVLKTSRFVFPSAF
ncbi:hypothetical protein F2Q70_00038841 [Brassica cretica]|uniref:Uncharacterized protein n=1 Tax=Brassica cretica TaxID=69181 RepID=A0A8S9KA72_BRACR|nr:hypothetical protein F2Q70_00038841 [Brassica cretica]